MNSSREMVVITVRMHAIAAAIPIAAQHRRENFDGQRGGAVVVQKDAGGQLGDDGDPAGAARPR